MNTIIVSTTARLANYITDLLHSFTDSLQILYFNELLMT